MKENRRAHLERYVLPARLVDFVEDSFSVILSVCLLGISAGAFFFSVKQLMKTHPFFPNGMIEGINNILFIVIILEILRTIISRFTDGIFQLDKFLIIGVIAAVRHILTVGASLTLESSKSDHIFYRNLAEIGADAAIALLLVVAISMSRASQHRHSNQSDDDKDL
jgi:uncharacterized membrane protein (DUF373 family)